ncbi:AcrR family transcriptional regulator [Nocardioides thalensis]|uniref:AcrR family transcriptional regulator n=1 Tax=Nocardioides thalensis TaxID=1914755 RepID=A0A853C2P2_9ACTN|nr:TetR/AcrR family transcriptional regulator [Nocardioides thalensis]NYJ01609.1 AcrR family transcriptional regulator [Nocardioides thalensis]
MAPDDAAEEVAVPDGRSLRWRKHNQARRQKIIDAAITVLGRQSPGEEVQIQAISEESGVARTVMYRHFADKADLDRAVQREICNRLGEVLIPALAHDGTPEEIIHRVIEGFVLWSVDNPSLFWFAERDLSGWGPTPLQEAFEKIAEAIEAIMDTVVAYVGVELSQDDRDGIDPWVFALIGAAFTGIRRWASRDPRVPDIQQFIDIMSESIWLQINGMALSRGITLPDGRIVDLLHSMGTEPGAVEPSQATGA